MKEKWTPQQRHYWLCLGLRIVIFLLVTAWAVLAEPGQFEADLAEVRLSPLLLAWLLLILSILRQFFPSPLKSTGSQKIFASKCRLTGRKPDREERRRANRGVWLVLLVWAAANGVFFLLYARGVVDKRFLVCLTAFYAVCDLICVLVFCPFRAWMMHNRCCTTCRIYDWDYMMMCTPLLAVGGWMAASACVAAGLLLLRWEAAWLLYPERIVESCNQALACSGCRERLCKYRRALGRKLRPGAEDCRVDR